jgi:hypothetical protein
MGLEKASPTDTLKASTVHRSSWNERVAGYLLPLHSLEQRESMHCACLETYQDSNSGQQ